MSEDEDMILWQDTLDEIMAGRRDGLVCPSCKKGALAVTTEARGLKISCPSCKKFLEGSMQPDDM